MHSKASTSLFSACVKFQWPDDHIISCNLVTFFKYAFNDHSPVYKLLLCSLMLLPASIHNLQIHKEWYRNTCNLSNTHFKNACSIEDDSIYSAELLKKHESKCNHESLLSFCSLECFQKWQFLGSCFINCCLYLLKFSADIINFSCTSNEMRQFLQTDYTWHTYSWSHSTHFKVNSCNAEKGEVRVYHVIEIQWLVGWLVGWMDGWKVGL